MHQRRSRVWVLLRLAGALSLALLVAAPGYAQPSTPPSGGAEPSLQPRSVASFLGSLVGEWIGTCVQSTDGEASDNKYFHAIIEQPSPDTYETIFEYYRLDPQTGEPIQVGAATMTTKVAPEGAATNTIVGSGEVLLDPETSKHAEYELFEVLSVSLAGGLVGTGSGRISVSGMPLGLGKHGQVQDFRSTWSEDDGVLNIAEHLKVKFKVLFFSKRFTIAAGYTAQRGSDIAGLMKSAFADKPRVKGAPQG